MYQTTTIIGSLGRDPEMRYMPNGDPVTDFSIATNREYKDKNGNKVKEVTWWRVSVFGAQAEPVNQYLHKGEFALVEGRMKPDENGNPKTYTKQDGTIAASYELVANTVRFFPKSMGNQEPGPGNAADLPAGRSNTASGARQPQRATPPTGSGVRDGDDF